MGEWALFTALPLLIGGACAMLAAFAFLHRGGVPGSIPFGFLVIAVSIYAAASGMEHASGAIERIVLSIRLEYVGIVFIGPLWLLFALRFSGKELPAYPILIALFAESVAALVAIWNPALFSDFYSQIGTVSERGMRVFTATRGILFWIHQAYASLCLLTGVIILIGYSRRAPILHRGNARIAVLASLIPWGVNMLYITGLLPARFDVGPFAIAISGGLFAWALFSRNLLDIVSTARQRVLEAMGDGTLVADIAGNVLDCNPAASRLMGLKSPALADVIRALHEPRYAELQALLVEGVGGRELSGFGHEGDLAVRAEAFTVVDEKGRSLANAVLLSDITQTSALLNRLQAQASVDGLTGALNRGKFGELASRDLDLARRNLRPIALVMVDIDHFKAINDHYGHAAGDEVLRAVCGRCRETLRTTDIFCRFGGDELAVLLPYTDSEGAGLVAERLRSSIASEPVAWDREAIAVTASFGVYASLPAEEETLGMFLKAADEALYEAKAAGRNRVSVKRD